MKFFKHQTDMRHDTKIRLLINRYGLEGYGLYNLILESISEELCEESPIPELKETCEQLAELYNGNTARFNEIASWMINAGLFEISEFTARITCLKIFKFLDPDSTRSPSLKKAITTFKRGALSPTVTDSHRQNPPEPEPEPEPEPFMSGHSARASTPDPWENLPDEPAPKAKSIRPTLAEVRAYCLERGNGVDPEQWFDHYTANGWKVGKAPMKDWRAAVRTWERSGLNRTEPGIDMDRIDRLARGVK